MYLVSRVSRGGMASQRATFQRPTLVEGDGDLAMVKSREFFSVDLYGYNKEAGLPVRPDVNRPPSKNV